MNKNVLLYFAQVSYKAAITNGIVHTRSLYSKGNLKTY